ncbi:hypothetical protein AAFC00_000106 [Neodothiora populina]|uniref:Actin-crosslinking protein n=1 Tax=Neodothiora populina TaxID=2781224 RepID=A0ABR3P2Q0_9PEZI
MVKALSFKGDKKVKKRKRTAVDGGDQDTSVSRTNPAEEGQDEESWVSADKEEDLKGPVLFVLPTQPVTCLACDANGKIFASQIENMIEDSPSTAEPHDVRQVWIANRVAGTDSFSFKGHHGKYLSCDKFGIPSASTEAISPEESFYCSPNTENMAGTFSIRTTRDKYFAVTEGSGAPEIRADADEISPDTAFRLRMQARFKPTLKASKEEQVREKISRAQLESEVGRRLEDDEVKKLKKARKEGTYHEALLDVKVKGKHDKFA